MKTALFIDDRFTSPHYDTLHWDNHKRISNIYEKLGTLDGKNIIYPSCVEASDSIFSLVHKEDYIKKVEGTKTAPFTKLADHTICTPESYDIFKLLAGSVLKGIDLIQNKKAGNAFVLGRPGGHHANSDTAQGFCVFNYIAIGAQYLLKKLKLSRILIIDFDLHHGNGTQDIFYNTDKVLFFSTHQSNCYPDSGYQDEIGVGEGKGYTVNVPLNVLSGDDDYIDVFTNILIPRAREYKPEFILVSAGYDAHTNDPMGDMKLTKNGFFSMTKIITNLADELCDGKVLFNLEGGYDIEGLTEGVLASIMEIAN
jgi:acetoin utilization deacetylase AcuC-like enzyme